MIRLELLGAHTRLHSTLCSACPQGTAGCCVSPPDLDWSDVGRVVALGGRDWLLAEIAEGRLAPRGHGLRILRVRKRESTADPRRKKCVYHGAHGCTIDASRRAATCNYFLCEDAFSEKVESQGDPEAQASRRAHAILMDVYSRWDRELAARIGAAWPGGPPWDAAFLDWLALELRALESASEAALSPLQPGALPRAATEEDAPSVAGGAERIR